MDASMKQDGQTNKRMNIPSLIIHLLLDLPNNSMQWSQLHQVQSFRYMIHILFDEIVHVIDAQSMFTVGISNTAYFP
jgi:hypothetical protein